MLLQALIKALVVPKRQQPSTVLLTPASCGLPGEETTKCSWAWGCDQGHPSSAEPPTSTCCKLATGRSCSTPGVPGGLAEGLGTEEAWGLCTHTHTHIPAWRCQPAADGKGPAAVPQQGKDKAVPGARGGLCASPPRHGHGAGGCGYLRLPTALGRELCSRSGLSALSTARLSSRFPL